MSGSESVWSDVSALDDVIGRRPRGRPQARRSRRTEILAKQLAAGHAELRAEEVLPGDTIRMGGNVWVVRDCRLGSEDVCFLITLGGHMHACERAQPVQLLSSEAKEPVGSRSARPLRRRAPVRPERIPA